MRARVVLPIVLIVALLALAPSSALANGAPTRQPVPNSFYTITPSGQAILVSQSGTQFNVCAALS